MNKSILFLVVFLILKIAVEKPFEGFLVDLLEEQSYASVRFGDVFKDGIEFVNDNNVSDDSACVMFFSHRIGHNTKRDVSNHDIDFTQEYL
ncbi:MAG: hypothetical protein KatS3mg087_1556 [Patescibacteria group bacterium]|nr:MAG: hypothetical protein KatS3mg087_1556 [Patescibacteria group bacterium]